ncbi:MAG: maleylacetoacetate isomerase [Betaproteobacteria bacterium]|nr:maleylacetoacetate isomerase [Betaproteobacteria bacterium]
MILYTYFRSSAAFRVRIALNLKGLTAEMRPINLLTKENRLAEYRTVNPQGFVPYLIDGELRLAQSLAIIEYLDETRPNPPLLPATPAERAFVRGVATLIACDIHPLNNTRVLDYLDSVLHVEKDQRSLWYQHWINEGFTVLEQLLAARPASTFCTGEAPSLADICLVPQVFNAQRFKVDVAPYRRIMAIFEACMKVPAFDAAQPSRQPDAT